MSEENPEVPIAEVADSEKVEAVLPAPVPIVNNPLSADLVSSNISLLARTGNGLSFAYTRLEIHSKGITDLDILESYPNLRYVDVSENAINNINGLSHLEYLLSFDAHSNNLTSVPAIIDKRKYLQQANFSKNRISSWNVTRWPLLSWINLNENALKTLSFEDFSELIHLEVRGNLLESLSQLNTPKLQRLYAAANQIKSLSDLDKLSQLNLLHVRGNQIENLDGLKCPKLTSLNLRDNKISDFAEIKKLSELSALRILSLAGNPIAELPNYRLQVLSRIPKLDRLDKEAVTNEERDDALQFGIQKEVLPCDMNEYQFLSTACSMLKVPNTVLSTAQYYFYLCHKNIGEFDQFVVMAAILNLSMKQHEIQRKFRDILNVCYHVSNRKLLKIDEEFWNLKSLIIQAEFLILKSLNFDTNVALPHNYCIIILYEIEKDLVNSDKCSMIEFQRLSQASLTIVTKIFNDRIVIPKDQDWTSKKDHSWNLAIASVFLATKVLNIKYKTLEKFVKDWGSSKDVVEEILEKEILLLQNL